MPKSSANMQKWNADRQMQVDAFAEAKKHEDKNQKAFDDIIERIDDNKLVNLTKFATLDKIIEKHEKLIDLQ